MAKWSLRLHRGLNELIPPLFPTLPCLLGIVLILRILKETRGSPIEGMK